MALPPERLESVADQIRVVVVGTVVEAPSFPEQEPALDRPAPVGAAAPWPTATLRVRVDEVVFGAGVSGSVIDVDKPAGAYWLRVGEGGPFALGADASGRAFILGRYGPDTWTLDTLKRRFAQGTP